MHHPVTGPEEVTAGVAGLGQVVFHKVAGATVRSLLARVADVLSPPLEPADAVQGTDRTGAAARRAAAEIP